jgi:hypothetical protein
MKRFRISHVNGLGHKKEITTVLADSFDYIGDELFTFFTHQTNWRGVVISRDQVGFYAHGGKSGILVEEVSSGE